MTAIFAVPEMTNFVFAHVPRPSRCNQQIIAFWAFHPVGRKIVAPVDRHDERPLSLASLYGVQRWTHYDMSNLDLGTCCFVSKPRAGARQWPITHAYFESIGSGAHGCVRGISHSLESNACEDTRLNQCSVTRPQHCLNFLPDPHGQGSLRPTFGAIRR
jgi:hypothetical protein